MLQVSSTHSIGYHQSSSPPAPTGRWKVASVGDEQVINVVLKTNPKRLYYLERGRDLFTQNHRNYIYCPLRFRVGQ